MSTETSIFRTATAARLKPAGHYRQEHDYILPAGTQVADFVDSTFWAPLHRQLQPWDEIRCIEEGGAFYARVLVLSSTPGSVIVAGLQITDLPGVAPRNFAPFDAEGCTVAHKGVHLKWCVLRPDGSQLQGGFSDEGAASAWLQGHIRTKRRA